MKNRKRLWVLICTLALSCSLIGCGVKQQEQQKEKPAAVPEAGKENEPDNGGNIGEQKKDGQKEDSEIPKKTSYPVTVVGSDGTEIVLQKEPERVISLGPNLTEIVYSLNVQEKLVGRTDFCDFPAETEQVESIGSIYPPDLEKILSLTPDLVIASAHFDETFGEKLKQLGIPVLYLYEEHSVEGVYTMIETLGTALNAAETAKTVVAQMKQTIADTAEAIQGLEPVTVYYVVGYGDGEFTAGGDTFIQGILTAAGGKNIAEEMNGWSYSLEQLLEKDPEVILLPSYFYDGFISEEPYKNLSAVKNKRVYVIDTSPLDRQCARNAEAIREIAVLLHPEAF